MVEPTWLAGSRFGTIIEECQWLESAGATFAKVEALTTGYRYYWY
jgi:hypothetical protein